MANVMTGTGLIAKIKADFGITLYPAVERAYAARLQAVIDANPTATDEALDSLLVNQLMKLSLIRNVLVQAFDDNGDGKISTVVELNTAKSALDGTVDAAQADAAAGNVSTGQTFTLTTGVDNVTGTSGNDTIIADNTGATKQLSVADQINGGAGTDTLKVFLATADTGTGQPTLTGIENVSINGGSIASYTAATGTTGLTVEAPTMTVNAAGSAVTAGNATYTLSGQAVTLKNLVGSTATSTAAAGSSALTYTTTLAQAATDSATSVAVTVDGLASKTRAHTDTTGPTTTNYTDTQTVDIAGSKYATLNLTASGDANSTFVLTNTGTALKTVNVAGNKNVTVSGSGADALKTINASTATGIVAIDVSGAARLGDFAFTGGSGNDTLTLRAADFTPLLSGAQLDGGAGTDTLVIKDTTLAYTKLNQVKNFEVLGLGANNAAVDAGQLTSIKSFSFGGQTAQTINNLGEGSSVAITGAMAGTVALGAAVGNSTTSLTLGTATSAGFTVSQLDMTGLINLTITSNGNGTAANVLTTFNNAENSNIVVKGSNDLTFSLAAGTTTGSKVDANAFTGKLNVTGSGFADILIGGSGADTIKGDAGNDQVTGGAGADKFVLTNTTAGGTDWIKDFQAGVDKIYTTNNTTGTTAALALVDKGALSTTTYADLNAAVASFASGGANQTAASNVYIFTYGTDTYAIVDNGTAGYAAGTDTLIKLTGVSGTLTANDFINA